MRGLRSPSRAGPVSPPSGWTACAHGHLGPLISNVKDICERLRGLRDTHYLDPGRKTVDVARSFPGRPEILGKKADGTERLPVDLLGELLRRGR